jgi:hypothetical protein
MIEAWWRSLKHQWLFLHAITMAWRAHSTASPPFTDWWRSMSTHTTGCCATRPFADRRRTRCTSAPGTHFRQTWPHARPPRAARACRPIDRRPASRAGRSRRGSDERRERQLGASTTTRLPVHPRIWMGRSARAPSGEWARTVSEATNPPSSCHTSRWRELARKGAECRWRQQGRRR